MTEIESQILSTLIEIDDGVKAMSTANPKPNLLPLFAKIDELAQRLPASTPPMLLHYLQKKSYQKARLFLEGRDAENTTGSCGHS